MNFSLTDEQQALRDSVLDFAKRALSGTGDGFDRERWQACADFGILGMPVPESLGGSGHGLVDTTVAMEALGIGCRDQGLLFSIHAHLWAVVTPLIEFGTDQQRERYLTGLMDGSILGGHAMSEPHSGSDAYALRTRATARDGGYVLDGTKTFVTNGPVADLFVVFATVNPARKMWGVTAFLIEKGTEGLSVSEPFEKLGLRSSPMSEVILEECWVPEEARLGAEGQGGPIFGHSMEWERGSILGSTVGRMAAQLDEVVAYAREREQFGRPIGDFQLVAGRIADMRIRLEAARLLLYRTAWQQESTGHAALEAAMAKTYISEAAVQSSLDAIQVLGGYGYMEEYPFAADLRDSVGGTLYSGTSEIQRLNIARELGLKP